MTEHDPLAAAGAALRAMEGRDYDPALDITAGELRRAGATGIGENVPDCAWVPRAAMHMGEVRVAAVDPDNKRRELRASFSVTFDKPFRWLEVSGTLVDE